MNRPVENSSPLRELERLAATETPPQELEERVVAELRARRLIEPPARRGIASGWLVAACLLAAMGGWLARGGLNWTTGAPPEASAAIERAVGGEYLLLLVEPRPLRTSKAIPVLVDEYRAWAAGVADRGQLVSAGHLRPGGPYLADSAAEPAGIDAVTGFFIVRAGSLEEAERLAGTCPHRTYGGEISIRPLAGTSDPPQV
ncbi:MAG: hypothetical protein AAF481_18895 [Acidobacteriota bacterium]